MSNVNEDLDYLGTQLKKGVLIGAGLTLFSSGVLIGVKAASFIVDIVKDIGADGLDSMKRSLRQAMEEALREEDDILYKKHKKHKDCKDCKDYKD